LWEISLDLKDGEPLAVDKFDNDTMLNFGYALLKQKPAFTFPRANNLRANKRVAINNKLN